MPVLQTFANAVNTVVRPLVLSPRWNRLVGKRMTVLTYTGRRSGRPITLPVGYRMTGHDRLLIDIAMPGRKTWWRNFTGEGGPLALHLDGRDRAGHGVVVRDGGTVSVDVTLDPMT
ncbi:hypothetical protein WIS52_14445 [Pseudonocardia nematodicida]|uniref:DUF385 domain-containing protein n=1 Tax=Pseudonocardia nematodicida TaxID=1206997 RepID=A0ABV1KB17_9PSEU